MTEVNSWPRKVAAAVCLFTMSCGVVNVAHAQETAAAASGLRALTSRIISNYQQAVSSLPPVGTTQQSPSGDAGGSQQVAMIQKPDDPALVQGRKYGDWVLQRHIRAIQDGGRLNPELLTYVDRGAKVDTSNLTRDALYMSQDGSLSSLLIKGGVGKFTVDNQDGNTLHTMAANHPLWEMTDYGARPIVMAQYDRISASGNISIITARKTTNGDLLIVSKNFTPEDGGPDSCVGPKDCVVGLANSDPYGFAKKFGGNPFREFKKDGFPNTWSDIEERAFMAVVGLAVIQQKASRAFVAAIQPDFKSWTTKRGKIRKKITTHSQAFVKPDWYLVAHPNLQIPGGYTAGFKTASGKTIYSPAPVIQAGQTHNLDDGRWQSVFYDTYTKSGWTLIAIIIMVAIVSAAIMTAGVALAGTSAFGSTIGGMITSTATTLGVSPYAAAAIVGAGLGATATYVGSVAADGRFGSLTDVQENGMFGVFSLKASDLSAQLPNINQMGGSVYSGLASIAGLDANVQQGKANVEIKKDGRIYLGGNQNWDGKYKSRGHLDGRAAVQAYASALPDASRAGNGINRYTGDGRGHANSYHVSFQGNPTQDVRASQVKEVGTILDSQGYVKRDGARSGDAEATLSDTTWLGVEGAKKADGSSMPSLLQPITLGNMIQ